LSCASDACQIIETLLTIPVLDLAVTPPVLTFNSLPGFLYFRSPSLKTALGQSLLSASSLSSLLGLFGDDRFNEYARPDVGTTFPSDWDSLPLALYFPPHELSRFPLSFFFGNCAFTDDGWPYEAHVCRFSFYFFGEYSTDVSHPSSRCVYPGPRFFPFCMDYVLRSPYFSSDHFLTSPCTPKHSFPPLLPPCHNEHLKTAFPTFPIVD